MATVGGGLFHAAPVATHVAAAPRPDAGPLSLASITGAHATSSGGGDSTTGGGTGFDTVSGQGDVRFAGNTPAGTDQVVATQTLEGGNSVFHLPDGSTLIVVGTVHPDIIIR